MLGISIDVTEQRMAEIAARELRGKLINAQEDERRRIARDQLGLEIAHGAGTSRNSPGSRWSSRLLPCR